MPVGEMSVSLGSNYQMDLTSNALSLHYVCFLFQHNLARCPLNKTQYRSQKAQRQSQSRVIHYGITNKPLYCDLR